MAALLSGSGLLIVPSQAQVASQRSLSVASSASAAATDTTKANVNVVDNHIAVSDAPANSRLEIYNIVGLKVKEIEIRYPSEEYVVSLPKGYYIVRIGEIVRKIVIR
jgi:hypothetical protein